MAIKKVFKNRLGDSVYMFRNGKSAHFIDGRFITDFEWEISELDQECKSGHPHLFIDETDFEIDTSLQDEIKAAQAEATKTVLANREANKAKSDVTISTVGLMELGKSTDPTLRKPINTPKILAPSEYPATKLMPASTVSNENLVGSSS